MSRRRRFHFSLQFPKFGLGHFSVYGHRLIWREALTHAAQLGVGAVAREVTLLWLLGLVTGSFALLQWDEQFPGLPRFALTLSRLIQSLLGSAPAAPVGEVSRIWIAAIALFAWLCLASGTAHVARLVSRAYQSSLTRRPRWANLTYHWLLTAVMAIIINLILFWIGPDLGTATMAADLKLKTAEGSAMAPTWQTSLWHLTRWPLSLGLFGLNLAMFYRLSPQRWARGTPLWTGVGLTTCCTAAGVGLSWWAIDTILNQMPAHGKLLAAAVSLLGLLWLVLLIPFGALFNGSLITHGAFPPTAGRQSHATVSPPSFETFKINRSPGDRFPRE